MEIGNFKLEKKPDKIIDLTEETQPPQKAFTQTTYADSAYYEDYDLRPYNPDSLFQRKGNYDLFDEMRGDDQIHSVLSLKKTMVLDSGWFIETENDEVKDFFDFQFDICLDELFEKKLWNILSALDFGYSLSELVFDTKQTKDFGTKILLTKLPTRPPHTFEFDQDDKGDVYKVRQDYRGSWIDIDPTKFLHFSYQKEFDNPYGKTEFNIGVYRNWYSKNALIKFWNIYNERFGMPTVHGKYPQGRQENIQQFEKILKNIQAKTSIITDDRYAVDYLQKSGQGESDYERAIQYYNMMIARSMLIPDLMGFSGDKTSGGSYSLGQEQFGVFWSVIEQIRKELERLINKHIVYPLTLWNFGSNEYAEFKFTPADEDNKQDLAKMWLEGVKTGKVIVTPEQQNYFLSIVEFPEIEEDIFEEEKQRKEEMALAIQGGNKDGLQDGKQEKGQPEEGQPKEVKQDEKEDKVKKESKPKQEFEKEVKETKERKLTTFEQKIDFEKLEADLDDITLQAYDELSDVFKMSINALADDIKRKKLIEKKRYDLINKLQIKHLGKINSTIKKFLKAGYEIGDIEQPLNFDVLKPIQMADVELNAWLTEYAGYLTGVEADFIINKVKPILINGLEAGMGVPEVMAEINTALSGYDFIKALPADQQKFNRLETLVRTFLSKSYNEARKNQFKKQEDRIVKYQFSAVMDHRTSQICQSLDKKIFAKDEAKRYWPPLHMRCFIPGTRIRTLNNKEKNIENIKIGNKVLSQSGKYYEVVELHKNHYSGDLIVIETENKTIKTTPEHPIWTENAGWKKAIDLTEDDILLSNIELGYRKRKLRRDNKINKYKDDVIDLYMNKQKSLRYIAKKYDKASSTIGKWLKDFGIELRQGSEAVKTQWINNEKRKKESAKSLLKMRKEHPEFWQGIKKPKLAELRKVKNPMFDSEIRKKAGLTKKGMFAGKKNPMYGKSPKHPKTIKYKNYLLRSSYELAYLKHLEKNKVEFEYEAQRYEFGEITYVPDFFIYENGELSKIIEIKGWVKDKDIKKINLLKEHYSNTDVIIEMVTEKELKQLGLLS